MSHLCVSCAVHESSQVLSAFFFFSFTGVMKVLLDSFFLSWMIFSWSWTKAIQGDFQNGKLSLCVLCESHSVFIKSIQLSVCLSLPLLPPWLLCSWEFKGEVEVKHGGSIWGFLAPR